MDRHRNATADNERVAPATLTPDQLRAQREKLTIKEWKLVGHCMWVCPSWHADQAILYVLDERKKKRGKSNN